MPVVVLKIPEPQTIPNQRPTHCPYCDGQVIQRWGKVQLTAKNGGVNPEEVFRYRCESCNRTFRSDSTEIGGPNYAELIQRVAGLAWLLGMSVRDVAELFERYGYSFSRMTIWREGQRLAALKRGADENRLQRFALDKVYVHGHSTRLGVVVAFNFGNGRMMVVGTVDEGSPVAVKKWLERLLGGDMMSVSILGTSTLDNFAGTSGTLSLQAVPGSGD